jgi:uncharacterized membrane protein
MSDMMLETDEKLNLVWWLLRIGLGVGVFLGGLDKFFGLLAFWPEYLSPFVAGLLPVRPETFLYVLGVFEVLIGLAILTRWTREGAYAMSGLLAVVALNVALAGHLWDVVRDFEMCLSAFALARLSAWRAATIEAYRRPEPATLFEETGM